MILIAMSDLKKRLFRIVFENKTEHAVQSYAAGNEVLAILKYELSIKGKQQC